ncbi:MAG: Flp family type IVb pilin [Bacillota bacterium]
MLWRKIKEVWTNEEGVTTTEYLLLALLITGVVAAIVTGVKSALVTTHNSVVNNIINITGSGY